MIHLSQRLKALSQLVPDQARLADIGSDHAYLPIYLVQNKIVAYALASEVAPGPYHHARTEISNYQLDDQIDVRMGDGLESIEAEDQIDCVVIAGMGGRLISRIIQDGLDHHKIPPHSLLILQPNNEEPYLRKVLVQSACHIQEELLVEENGHCYDIITASFAPSLPADGWTDPDFFFGKQTQASNPSLFRKKWQRELRKMDKVLKELAQSQTDQYQKRQEIEAKKSWIEERLACTT